MSSNVHRLNDLEAGPWGHPRSDGLTTVIPSASGPPRCIDLFLPGFSWRSAIVWISVVQIVVYCISIGLGSHDLVPGNNTLINMGSAYAPLLQKWQIWRVVTPIFLHGSIWHILFNVFFQTRIGLSVEQTYGTLKTVAVYFFTGIGANLFTMAWAPCKSSVGASGAGFGLIGLQMAELALTWHLLRNRDEAIFNIVFFVLISIMISINPGSAVDWRGHLGGFILGFCAGMPLNREMLNPPRWLKTYGLMGAAVVSCAIYVACTAVLIIFPADARC